MSSNEWEVCDQMQDYRLVAQMDWILQLKGTATYTVARARVSCRQWTY
jgi:hypothetical protein